MLAEKSNKIKIELKLNSIESEIIIIDNLIDLNKKIDDFLKNYKIFEKKKKEKI